MIFTDYAPKKINDKMCVWLQRTSTQTVGKDTWKPCRQANVR